MTYCLHNNYIGRCPISISSSSIFSKSASFQRSFCASLSSFVFFSPSFIKTLQPVHCVFFQYKSYTPQVQDCKAGVFVIGTSGTLCFGRQLNGNNGNPLMFLPYFQGELFTGKLKDIYFLFEPTDLVIATIFIFGKRDKQL